MSSTCAHRSRPHDRFFAAGTFRTPASRLPVHFWLTVVDNDKQSSQLDEATTTTRGFLELPIRFIRLFGFIAITGSLAALVASYNWLADWAAQLRVQYLIMLLPALVLWTRKRQHRILFAGGVAFALNLWSVIPYVIPITGLASKPMEDSGNRQSSIRLLVLNVLRTNKQLSETLNDVLSHDADFVFLMEVSPDWKSVLENVRNKYPHQKHILRDDYTGVALLSKNPWLDIKVINTDDANPPLDVSFPPMNGQSQPFRVIATHPLPPFGPSLTRSRDTQLVNLANRFREGQPGLLIGDFNLTPWSPRFRAILNEGKLTDAALGHGLSPTLTPLPTVFGGIKVDHVLVTGNVNIDSYQVSPCAHSDHQMLIVSFNIASKAMLRASPELNATDSTTRP